MTGEELVTFCLLKGDVLQHDQLKDHLKNLTDFYHIRVYYGNSIISIQYHKGDDGELTFIEGRRTTMSENLGTLGEPIYGFHHLISMIS